MTWFITIAILGAVVWQAGPMPFDQCEKDAKPSVIDRVDSMTSNGVVSFQGRTAPRSEVRVYCTEDEAR